MGVTKRVFALLIFLEAIPASWACSYDGQFSNPFAESYEGALDVAIATQQAVNAETLQPSSTIEGAKGLRQVSWWLKLWVEKETIPSDTFIYLVDSQLWSHHTENNQLLVHSGVPQNEQSQVILLSETALDNLVQERVSFDSAVDLGIVLVR